MIGKVAQRREARMASIVDASWDLARREGIGGVTLRGLARELGISQPSLYEYFDSKAALFDVLFADGNRRLLARLDATPLPDEPRAAVKVFMRTFVEFSLEDDARLALLFQRPIPGFRPSPASFAVAEQVLERAVALLRTAGARDDGDVDCCIAMVGGLIAAQAGNDPGGTRWTQHLERLLDLYLDNPITDTPRRAR